MRGASVPGNLAFAVVVNWRAHKRLHYLTNPLSGPLQGPCRPPAGPLQTPFRLPSEPHEALPPSGNQRRSPHPAFRLSYQARKLRKSRVGSIPLRLRHALAARSTRLADPRLANPTRFPLSPFAGEQYYHTGSHALEPVVAAEAVAGSPVQLQLSPDERQTLLVTHPRQLTLHDSLTLNRSRAWSPTHGGSIVASTFNCTGTQVRRTPNERGAGIFSRRTNRTQEARACSRDGPIGRGKRGYILTTYQSDAGSAGIFFVITLAVTTEHPHKQAPPAPLCRPRCIPFTRICLGSRIPPSRSTPL
eukprot:8657810-Pyramimonas_sp.AAC.1